MILILNNFPLYQPSSLFTSLQICSSKESQPIEINPYKHLQISSPLALFLRDIIIYPQTLLKRRDYESPQNPGICPSNGKSKKHILHLKRVTVSNPRGPLSPSDLSVQIPAFKHLSGQLISQLLSCTFLVGGFSPTHLKHMLVTLDHLPK